MATVGIKSTAYCLNFAPELALHYGGTPSQERHAKPDSDYLKALPGQAQSYEEAAGYAPNKTYIGAMSVEELTAAPAPWLEHLGAPERYGKYGEIMPEDEFIGFMDICDVFDLIWLDKDFAARIKESWLRIRSWAKARWPAWKPGTRPPKSPKPWKSTGPCPCIWTARWWAAAAGPMTRTKTFRPTSCWKIWPARPAACWPCSI